MDLNILRKTLERIEQDASTTLDSLREAKDFDLSKATPAEYNLINSLSSIKWSIQEVAGEQNWITREYYD